MHISGCHELLHVEGYFYNKKRSIILPKSVLEMKLLLFINKLIKIVSAESGWKEWGLSGLPTKSPSSIILLSLPGLSTVRIDWAYLSFQPSGVIYCGNCCILKSIGWNWSPFYFTLNVTHFVVIWFECPLSDSQWANCSFGLIWKRYLEFQSNTPSLTVLPICSLRLQVHFFLF